MGFRHTEHRRKPTVPISIMSTGHSNTPTKTFPEHTQGRSGGSHWDEETNGGPSIDRGADGDHCVPVAVSEVVQEAGKENHDSPISPNTTPNPQEHALPRLPFIQPVCSPDSSHRSYLESWYAVTVPPSTTWADPMNLLQISPAECRLALKAPQQHPQKPRAVTDPMAELPLPNDRLSPPHASHNTRAGNQPPPAPRPRTIELPGQGVPAPSLLNVNACLQNRNGMLPFNRWAVYTSPSRLINYLHLSRYSATTPLTRSMRLYHPAFATNDGIVEVFPQDIMFGRREHVNVGDVLEKIGEAVAAARLAGNMERAGIPPPSDSVYHGLGSWDQSRDIFFGGLEAVSWMHGVWEVLLVDAIGQRI
ncbi:hypothetical protein DFP72DRAFT_850563 [Ephemerocybe angulata]|uniref:Uncharacterized protein n=1 Tax=Ephemerocybe angulata TaxID=980116 RepID=A0A8H6HS38_9AGAR|nr:hypothetical protein DFP72DRAFT_850563 [Tulosesus angulatus]